VCTHKVLTHIFFDGYCSTVQGLLDWFEVDLGFTELSFIQIDLCVLCVFDTYHSHAYTRMYIMYIYIYTYMYAYIYVNMYIHI